MTSDLEKKANHIVTNTILPEFNERIVSVAIVLNTKDKYPIEVESVSKKILSFNFKNKKLADEVMNIISRSFTGE